MSYRSLKRVLGETSLERKCRILFGLCLMVLITIAFWYAERNVERLLTDKLRVVARDYADLSWFRYHVMAYAKWRMIATNESPDGKQEPGGLESSQPAEARGFYDMVELANEAVLGKNFRWEILVRSLAGQDQTIIDRSQVVRPVRDDREAAIFEWLAQQVDLQAANMEKLSEQRDQQFVIPAATPSLNRTGEVGAKISPDFRPIYYLEREGSNYYYYQPVYWVNSCLSCHTALIPTSAMTAADRGEVFGVNLPLRVQKVAIPNAEIEHAIHLSRAWLLATGIVTVFVAMIALYAVVRYVIVKPLQHLRDVSDSISHGNYNLRAEIHTNDEFEELAESFNRMLRHLVDVQRELRDVNEDLDGKVDQLAQANMQLHEMNRLKSEFLASMSHELRTPLNSIIGFSDVLTGIDLLNDKQKRYVENIRKSGRVLLDMINDILDLAKLESGRMEVRPSEFKIESIVAAQADMVRSLAEEKNIDLEVMIQSELPELFQDQSKIQQILTNLLSNAIKFTPEGGRIVVGAAQSPEGDCLLTVADTGIGIPEEDRERIFEKFRQGSVHAGKDMLTREISGTGLGLSIVKELCRLLGGDVSFTSELGKGSTFYIRLPWAIPVQPRRDSMLASRLDELTKARRREEVSGPAPAGSPSAGSAPATSAAQATFSAPAGLTPQAGLAAGGIIEGTSGGTERD
ncbi:MAG: ATP-binding protein [Pirellulales bacterium]